LTAALPPGSKPAAPQLTLLREIHDAAGANLTLGFRPSEDLHGYGTLVGPLRVTHARR